MTDFKRCYGCKTENELDLKYCIKCGSANFDMKGVVQSVVAASKDEEKVQITQAVEASMISTLQSLPGFKLVRSLGIVSEFANASGPIASVKGDRAPERAMLRLREQAWSVGANAILGISINPSGAGMALTTKLGGDASLILMGTAVLVENDQV